MQNTKILFDAAARAGVERIIHISITNPAERSHLEYFCDNVIINAIGPETYSYRSLIQEIGLIIGKNRPIISLPPFVGYGVGWLLGKIANDVMITRDEIEGLMANFLYVGSPPTGHTRLTE